VRAIESGFQTRAIEQAAYQHQMALERGERVIVGLNRFVDPDEEPLPRSRSIPRSKRPRRPRPRVQGLAGRAATRHARERLEETGPAEMNLTPGVIDAVKAGATSARFPIRCARVYGGHDPNA